MLLASLCHSYVYFYFCNQLKLVKLGAGGGLRLGIEQAKNSTC